MQHMFDGILRARAKYDYAAVQKAAALERIKLNNERIVKLKTKLDEMRGLETQMQSYLDNLNISRAAVIREAKEYQNRRIEYLNQVVTEALVRIFPDCTMTARLNYDFMRNDIAKLVLVDGDGYEHIPSISLGKLMQYLISVSAVACITQSLQYNALFIDEAFGVANALHMEDLGNLLQSMVDNGMQVVLISQNSALYASLKRHEVQLQTVPAGGGAGKSSTKAIVAKQEDL